MKLVGRFQILFFYHKKVNKSGFQPFQISKKVVSYNNGYKLQNRPKQGTKVRLQMGV